MTEATAVETTTETKPPKYPHRPAIEVLPLQQMLDERGAGEFKRGSRPRSALYASELGHCQRAVWLEWHHPKPRDEKFSQGRGWLGHCVEHGIKEWIRPFFVEDEVTLRDDRVSGRVDFVLRFGKDYPQVPMEVKSTYAFDKFCSEPMLEHLLQIRWYLQQQPDSPYGLLCYVNLANWNGQSGKRMVLVIPRDDAQVQARVDRLWKVVHQTKEPECEEPEGVTKCFWCSIASGAEMMPV